MIFAQMFINLPTNIGKTTRKLEVDTMQNEKITSIVQIEEVKPSDRRIGKEGNMMSTNVLR